jgi:hypothetical protein
MWNLPLRMQKGSVYGTPLFHDVVPAFNENLFVEPRYAGMGTFGDRAASPFERSASPFARTSSPFTDGRVASPFDNRAATPSSFAESHSHFKENSPFKEEAQFDFAPRFNSDYSLGMDMDPTLTLTPRVDSRMDVQSLAAHSLTLSTPTMSEYKPAPAFPSNFNLELAAPETAHTHHVSLLHILPLVSEFLTSTRNGADRARIDTMLTHWFDNLPGWMQTSDPVPLTLYFDARILLHKAAQEDTVYTGLLGTEPTVSKLICAHAAISISLLRPSPDLFRPFVTAALVLLSAYQQNVMDVGADYMRDRVEGCIAALEFLGHSVLIARWDAQKLRAACEATFKHLG